MEEESFEDIEIATFINKNYIAIKVDREDRPDINAIYMSAIQAITGRGGWPMTVWLTPDNNPEQVQQAGVDITKAIQKNLAPVKGGNKISQHVLKNSLQHYKSSYDSINGGTTGAPKFPSTMPVRLLFRYYYCSDTTIIMKTKLRLPWQRKH